MPPARSKWSVTGGGPPPAPVGRGKGTPIPIPMIGGISLVQGNYIAGGGVGAVHTLGRDREQSPRWNRHEGDGVIVSINGHHVSSRTYIDSTGEQARLGSESEGEVSRVTRRDGGEPSCGFDEVLFRALGHRFRLNRT